MINKSNRKKNQKIVIWANIQIEDTLEVIYGQCSGCIVHSPSHTKYTIAGWNYV